jgi:O-antigen/teichoic acid export membrane protein
MRSALERSTRFNVGAQLVALIGNLVVTPIFVRSLGPADYGVWAVVLAISGTASALDFGMAVALVRATPEHVAAGRYDSIASLTVAASLFYAALTSVGVIVAILLMIVGPATQQLTVLLAATAVFAASNAASVPRALLQGLQRFDVSATLTIAGYLAFWLIGTALVSSGGGVASLAVAMSVMFLVQAMGAATVIVRSQPQLWWALRHVGRIERSSWMYMLRFGGQIQVSYVADMVKTNGPRLLAATLFGPVAAGMYDIGARIANAAWAIPAALLPAIVPVAAAANAINDQAELRALYLRGTRWLVVVALPMGVLFAATADLIMQTWIGPGYGSAVFVLVCLSLGNVLHLSTGAGTFVARGVSRPDVEVKYQTITLALYIVLGAALQALFGFPGIPLAVAVASVIGGIVFALLFMRWFGVQPAGLVRELVGPVLATLIALASLWVTTQFVETAAGLVQLFALATTFTVAYLGALVGLARRMPVLA